MSVTRRTYCRFGGSGSTPDIYRFPEPREGMARTTMHKIVSEGVRVASALSEWPVRVRDLLTRRIRAESTQSTAAAMLLTNSLGIWRNPVRCQRILLQRHLALSRFPDRGAVSVGRTRPRTPTQRVRPTLGAYPDTQRPLAQHESTFNTSDSPLWEESHQRRPSS